MVYSPKGIADIFKNYYQELYSVEQRKARSGEKSRKIINFLRKAGLPKIDVKAREALEAPISEDEIRKALSRHWGKAQRLMDLHCFTIKNIKQL